MSSAILVTLGAIGGAIATIIIGFVGNVLFQMWSEKRSKPKVDTFAFYYDGFPKGLTQIFVDEVIPDDFWNRVPKDKQYLIDNMRLYTFYVHVSGAAVVKNLKIKAHANKGSGIAFYKFLVEKQIVCDRLSVEQDEDRSLTAIWTYLNPDEFLEFHLLATAKSERADITIDVDGEGIHVRETFPTDPVNLLNPLQYPFISAKNDQFLLRFVRNAMLAMSHGQKQLPTWVKPRD